MKNSPMAHPAYGARYCSVADWAAEALTTVVYSSAPDSSRAETTPATVESF